MDIKAYAVVFITIFLAEIGDKTQLATILFSTNGEVNKIGIFAAASLALILATAIGVFFGSTLTLYISAKTLNLTASLSFILIGSWILFGSI